MLRKAVCPECGSSNIMVQQFIRVILPMSDAQQEIDKDIINKETTTVVDDDPILTLTYCGECNHQISRDVDFGNKIKNKDLTDELCKRLDTLEQFRTDTFAKEFRAEIDAHDFSDQYHQIEKFKGNNGYLHTEEVEDTKELIDRLFGADEESEEVYSDESEDDTEDSGGIVWDYSED